MTAAERFAAALSAKTVRGEAHDLYAIMREATKWGFHA